MNFRRFLLSIALLGAIAGDASALAASPAYTKGVTAYGAKNFREAVKQFGDVVRAEPRNLSAVFYLANSYYSLGQQTAALSYFRWLATNYPGTNEGKSAQTVLDRLGAQATARGETVGTSDSTPRAAVTKGGGSANAEELVVVVKNLADHPAVQPEVLKSVKSAVKSAPPGILSLLQANGCKVQMTPTMIDYDPSLLNTQPRGYEQGKTFKNVPACFDGHNIIVCNYAMRGTDEWEPTDDPSGSVRHEMGHAVDHYLGRITEEDEFKHMYYKDCGKLEPEQKEKLSYYVQKSSGGPSECFAECVCTILGGRKKDDQHSNDIRQAFPNVIKFIEGKINSL